MSSTAVRRPKHRAEDRPREPRKPHVVQLVISWLYLAAVAFFLYEVVFGGLWIILVITLGFALFALFLAYGTFLAVDSVQMVLHKGEYSRDGKAK